MSGPGFAVIDCETTGVFPGGHDRVIKIAVVHVDSLGNVGDQWQTLVNPGRDLGPQHIRRIAAADIWEASNSGQIAAKLAEHLSGRAVVAHNASRLRARLWAGIPVHDAACETPPQPRPPRSLRLTNAVAVFDSSTAVLNAR